MAILASCKHGALFIGVTRDLIRRVFEHKSGFVPGFTHRYGVKHLAWFQHCESVVTAIGREKQMKAGGRDLKIKLIERANPDWDDIFPALLSYCAHENSRH